MAPNNVKIGQIKYSQVYLYLPMRTQPFADD